MASTANRKVYQLKVSLRGIRPPIWRRVQVPATSTLAELHGILQSVLGWTNSHLHDFECRGEHYGMPSPEDFVEVIDEAGVRLGDLGLRARSRIRYLYDFGDSWEHDIVVEQTLDVDPDVTYPLCLAGKRACPPEDCGGVGGYENLIEALNRAADPNQKASRGDREFVKWAGPFSPEHFSLDEANGSLRAVGNGRRLAKRQPTKKRSPKTWILPNGKLIRLVKG